MTPVVGFERHIKLTDDLTIKGLQLFLLKFLNFLQFENFSISNMMLTSWMQQMQSIDKWQLLMQSSENDKDF